MKRPVTVVYVSADVDETLRQKLEVHLSLLEQQGVMEGWHSQQILPGSVQKESQDDAFNEASLVLLLISADFFASAACREQMHRALERQQQREVTVLPILLRPVERKDAPFAHLQVLPRNGKPVTSWSNQDAAFAHVAEEVRCVLEGKPLPSEERLVSSKSVTLPERVEMFSSAPNRGLVQIQEMATSANSDRLLMKNLHDLQQCTEFYERVRTLLALAQYEPIDMILPENSPLGFYIAEVKAGLNTLRYGIFIFYNEVDDCRPEEVQRIADFFVQHMGPMDLTRGELITKREVNSQVKAIIDPYIKAKTEESIWKGLINFNKYLRKLIEVYERSSDESKDVPLAKVYIHLGSEYRLYEEELYQNPTLRSPGARYCEAWKGDIEEAVRRWLKSPDPSDSSLALLADYGSGKTTFCQHMAAMLAKEYLTARENGDAHHRIPLWIPLMDFAKAPFDLHSFLTDHLKRRCKVDNPDSEALLKMAEAGLVFFMFDGFDEMASRANKDTVRQNILLFKQLTNLSQNKVMLTTRLEYFMTHSEEQHILGSFPRLYLQPLNDQQIDLYLQKRVPFIKARVGAVTKDWQYYRNIIGNIHDLSDLARRPVLLEMIIKTLPILIAEGKAVNRPNLYYRYLQGELERQLAKLRRDLLIDGQKRFEIMERIALELYQTNQTELFSNKIREISKDLLTVEQRSELEGSLREILTCSFLIRIGDVYRFSHQSFQEYLVARCLARDISHDRREAFRLKLINPTIQGFLLELEIGTIQQYANNSSTVSLADPNINFDYQILAQWLREESNDKLIKNNVISLLAKLMLPGQLRRISLRGADLSNAKLSGAELGEADLSLANLCQADLSDAKLSGVDLRGADLSLANLRGVDLGRAQLFGAVLKNANLTNADLRNADLRNADLEGVSGLEFTRSLERTDMYAVKGLTQEQFKICVEKGAIVRGAKVDRIKRYRIEE